MNNNFCFSNISRSVKNSKLRGVNAIQRPIGKTYRSASIDIKDNPSKIEKSKFLRNKFPLFKIVPSKNISLKDKKSQWLRKERNWIEEDFDIKSLLEE